MPCVHALFLGFEGVYICCAVRRIAGHLLPVCVRVNLVSRPRAPSLLLAVVPLRLLSVTERFSEAAEHLLRRK